MSKAPGLRKMPAGSAGSQKRQPEFWILASVLLLFFVLYAALYIRFHETINEIARDIYKTALSKSRAFNIPSTSLAPTLVVGDHFMANMNAYKNDDPERGDIVVYLQSRQQDVYFVSRIIGLPGEAVQIVDGIVHIDGIPLRRVQIDSYFFEEGVHGWSQNPVDQFIEFIDDETYYNILELTEDGYYDNTFFYKIPEGHYFVLGDNRDNSIDSRLIKDIGYIHRDLIHGQADFIYYSRDLRRIGTRLD